MSHVTIYATVVYATIVWRFVQQVCVVLCCLGGEKKLISHDSPVFVSYSR